MPRGSKGLCPPGIFCISNGTISTILGFAAVIAFFCIAYALTNGKHMPTIIMPPSSQKSTIVNAGDSRYQRAPEPLRSYFSPIIPPSMGFNGLPVNIPTRGLPESFQSFGFIKSGKDILPLYGRRSANSSDRYNYYTRTDTYNPVQIPIKYKRRDCMDDTGCDELFSGEEIKIEGLNTKGEVNIYKFGGPQYIPGII